MVVQKKKARHGLQLQLWLVAVLALVVVNHFTVRAEESSILEGATI